MIKIHTDIVQGTDEWLEMRRGILTASEMKLILTPTLKVASNDAERSHLYDLLAQRITGRVEAHYQNDEMLAGHEAEYHVKEYYATKNDEPVSVGFITNTSLGFKIGYSPDALVGEHGLMEIKKRRQKHHLKTMLSGTVPDEHIMQCQAGLFVSGRQWIDYCSYCAGLPLFIIRVYPIKEIQDAIVTAATAFEGRIVKALEAYNEILATNNRLIPTEYREYGEIVI
jgi:5-hydroxyisourate hydrolase-like protein (transthyretin family)